LLRTLVALSLLAVGPAQAVSQEPPPDLLIRNVTVVDGTGRPARPGLDVLVRGGAIHSVSPTTDGIDFDGRTLDGSGRFLIPGLVDAHVHVAGSARPEVAALLRWALEGGVTSVRDMAGDARDLAGIDQALARGEMTGPRLYYSALMAGEPFLSDPRLQDATVGYAPGTAPYMIPVTRETDFVRAVAMAKGTGATGLKLYAALDAETVAEVTAEAHRQGLRVWAHSAVFPAKPVEILDAGVDGVSHAPYVIWEAEPPTTDFTLRSRGDFARVSPDGPEMAEVVAAMVRNGIVLDPTLHVFSRTRDDDPTAEARLAWGARFTRRAREAGVTIAAGTDGLGDPLAGALPNVHDELRLLVDRAGFTPLQALRAGTLGGAEAIGASAGLGSVEVGKSADLVLLAGDPTQDISNTRTLVHVIQGGRVVR
jgi:imidazolonepropionase-like amidohydrolase